MQARNTSDKKADEKHSGSNRISKGTDGGCVDAKREWEKNIVSLMISLYCRKKHGGKKCGGFLKGHRADTSVLCAECAELDRYARQQIDRCPFMETKTFCSNCKVHCYRPEMREKIREVMKFSGPRMLFHHPIMAIRHVLTSKRER